MHLFLTSNPGGYTFGPGGRVPCPLDARNGLVEALRGVWPAEAPRCVVLASDPESHTVTDAVCATLREAFALSGLPLEGIEVCDSRNETALPALVRGAGLLIFCGGHVPTQNAFFSHIHLAETLRGYDGIVLGISAGSMNSGCTVYAQPERPGEAADAAYPRWLPGLDLVETSLLPHWQAIQRDTVDGLRIYEDLCLPDSQHHPFYAIADGSWLYADGKHETLYGDAWRFENGSCEKVCCAGQSLQLR